MKEKPDGYPIFTRLQDFQECGVVYRYLVSNPSAVDSEIARATKLPKDRVASIRIYLEYEFGFSKPWWQKPQSVKSGYLDLNQPAEDRETIETYKRNEKIKQLTEKMFKYRRSTNSYDILGIKKDSEYRQVEDAYKKLVMKWHPDRIGYANDHEIWEMSNEICGKINQAHDEIVKRLEQ